MLTGFSSKEPYKGLVALDQSIFGAHCPSVKIELAVDGKIALVHTQAPLEPPQAEAGLSALTNQQIVLIFYYTLQVWGIKPRVTVDIAPIARFMHLVLDKPYRSLSYSDLYKKLQAIPHCGHRKRFIRDLERIKACFRQIGRAHV